jgi:NAD(P)-dependent dehydrogenase (short-subunit alcohol dehydrogenase family)
LQTVSEKKTKSCLVFGGSGAVGGAVVKVLARESGNVAFTYHRHQDKAQQLTQTLKSLDCNAHSLTCDVRDAGQVRDCVQYTQDMLGGLDAVIYCVGVTGRGKFYQQLSAGGIERLREISQQDLLELFTVNAQGAFNMCQAAADAMQKKGGNIIIIGAMDGIKSVPSPVHFAMSKAALKGLVESAAKELGSANIRVNLVAPGVLTQGASAILAEELKQTYIKHCGLKRLGEAAEVAELAAWLALENTYLTGQCILLDGGL